VWWKRGNNPSFIAMFCCILSIFQVQRFVTLANEIDKIRPARDGLRILFLKCCMESLATLSGIKNKKALRVLPPTAPLLSSMCFSI
jgi:hypothetical protein